MLLSPAYGVPRRALRTAVAACAAWAALVAASPAAAQSLPPEVEAALARAKLPRESLSAVVVDADGTAAPRLAWRATVPSNPASVMKLVTTYAALDLLGPAYSWNTPVYADGPVTAARTAAGDGSQREGVLQGNLYIQGQGDPSMVLERLWLLLRRVQASGVTAIAGDIVLDRSAFDVPPVDPAAFDGEPFRPYNATPDALLLNYKSFVASFTPDPATGTARVAYDLPLAGVQMQGSVPLAAGDCGDWRGALRPEFRDPSRVQFLGSFPGACGEKTWPVAYADPQSFAPRLVEALWRELGGQLTGKVRSGSVPPGLKPLLQVSSPPLAEVIRDINKFSNNVMAQQVFLTLALPYRDAPTARSQRLAPASFDAARGVLRGWWQQRFGPEGMPEPDNGAGLSRNARISAAALARMLQTAWRSPLMPDLAASLPLTGVDGTLRRRQVQAAAHLKTGSLRDVAAIAGYVHGANGRRYVLVAMVNDPNAGAARAALDALIDWTARER